MTSPLIETASSSYSRWAEIEARGASAIYDDWATGIAQDPEILALITSLPRNKWQPNLVFAGARFAGAPLGPASEFIPWLKENRGAVRHVILTRSTQTNEAGRCAVLLPALSQLEGPLALIEAGASAGLCLYPDRYSYRYEAADGTAVLHPQTGPSRVVLPCSIDEASIPSTLPNVVWRAGADINPIDPTDPDQIAWLETLVWPEHDERRHRLRTASNIAAEDPPHLIAGDLIDQIPRLIEEAPRGSHIVVFHSSVLVYLEPERRQEFSDLMMSMPDITWISNEGADVLPSIRTQVTTQIDGRTILAVNGKALALVGPHGQSYSALP